MPKSTNAHGATYAGHVDVTPPGVTPQWEQLALFEVPRETSESDAASTTVGEAVDAPRKPGRPKGSRNKTTASAGNAAGSGSTGLA
jgi:hypothetical protein